eukprot:11390571-Heterocapsa_arctica.AAC.1
MEASDTDTDYKVDIDYKHVTTYKADTEYTTDPDYKADTDRRLQVRHRLQAFDRHGGVLHRHRLQARLSCCVVWSLNQDSHHVARPQAWDDRL